MIYKFHGFIQQMFIEEKATSDWRFGKMTLDGRLGVPTEAVGLMRESWWEKTMAWSRDLAVEMK